MNDSTHYITEHHAQIECLAVNMCSWPNTLPGSTFCISFTIVLFCRGLILHVLVGLLVDNQPDMCSWPNILPGFTLCTLFAIVLFHRGVILHVLVGLLVDNQPKTYHFKCSETNIFKPFTYYNLV